MNSVKPLLECVPNFSEGRDTNKINAIAHAIRSVPGVVLLHIDISPAANRTVMTFAGEPAAVVEAAFKAIQAAAHVIDMVTQAGVHPRIGATDVCPLVPLAGIDMQEAVEWSHKLAERVGRELGIPVYMYEHSAKGLHRTALPDIRKGQYEGFAEKMRGEQWRPDYGPSEFVARTGATVIGARDVLVAFNIALDTQDVTKASYIADRIRERGYVQNEDGIKTKIKGILPKLRAIGWYMADFECAEVSMNLLDYRITSALEVWNTCEALAANIGTTLTGSEVIGLIPEACLVETGTFAYLKTGQEVPADKKILLEAGIQYMGLSNLKPFNPQEKVLEYALHNAALIQ